MKEREKDERKHLRSFILDLICFQLLCYVHNAVACCYSLLSFSLSLSSTVRCIIKRRVCTNAKKAEVFQAIVAIRRHRIYLPSRKNAWYHHRRPDTEAERRNQEQITSQADSKASLEERRDDNAAVETHWELIGAASHRFSSM